jgi:phosphoribosyl 1,2-cyclic phosphodiesterase
VAIAANVKKLVIFHHDPLHNDDFLDQVGEQAAEQFANTFMAREGWSLQLVDFPAPNLASVGERQSSV